MNTNTTSRGQNNIMGGLLLLSSQIMPISVEKSSKSKSSSSCCLRRRNSGRRAKHQAECKALSTGDLRRPSPYNLRSKSRSSFVEQAGSLNETWDDAAHTTSSFSERAASSCNLVTHAQHRSVNFKDNKSSDCSEILHRPKDRKVPKPSPSSGASDTTTRSNAKAGKHVHFSFACSSEISYEVTSDYIKNSWLDIDVSSSIESAMDENQDMIVSFGPTGRFTMLDMDLCKNGNSYMVLIQQNRLVNEMLGQRTNHRRSVLEEQARQKREGVVDTEKLHAIASNDSKWGVELVRSSWWLCRA